MIFAHLKAIHFVNLMEGTELTAGRKLHLDKCTRCRTTWHSLEAVREDVIVKHDAIPEPDWDLFRSSVRNRLLARAIQRESAMWRWTGWSVRPAMAWALSLLIAIGIPTGAFVWHLTRDHASAPALVETLPANPDVELIDAGTDKAVFDDLIQLTDAEQERFRQMLESTQKTGLIQ